MVESGYASRPFSMQFCPRWLLAKGLCCCVVTVALCPQGVANFLPPTRQDTLHYTHRKNVVFFRATKTRLDMSGRPRLARSQKIKPDGQLCGYGTLAAPKKRAITVSGRPGFCLVSETG